MKNEERPEVFKIKSGEWMCRYKGYTHNITGNTAEAFQALEAEKDEYQELYEETMADYKSFRHLSEELEKQLQKMKEYATHKFDCEIKGAGFWKSEQQRKCTCGLDELLNQKP